MRFKKSIFIISIVLLSSGNTFTQDLNYEAEKIQSISKGGLIIKNVETISDTLFTSESGKVYKTSFPFVRVVFKCKPTQESNINCELWLPITNWNGRLLGTGNGGGAGGINHNILSAGLQRGFAVANTDMGTSPNAHSISKFPEKWKDFGYRATHEMTVASKIILKEFYKTEPDYSYFVGCSTGGQQALMEAQRFPHDYDGIIAGAPANNRTHLHASFIWNLIANDGSMDDEIITAEKLNLLSKYVIESSVGKDGGAPDDNFISDPRLCDFDFSTLPVCDDNSDNSKCFTQDEIAALKKFYSGPVNPRTSERIYTPLPLGADWINLNPYHLYLFKWVFGDDFDYMDFDFDHDMELVDSVLAPILNANNPDLSQLKNNGGKLIMYAGTDDQLVPYQDALNYYERVIEKQGGVENTQEFFRFFLVPGMAHCSGGPGPDNFGQRLDKQKNMDAEHDILTALIEWVENGISPERIVASTYDKTVPETEARAQRPVFPYPKTIHYVGGDINKASSYVGKVSLRDGVAKPAEKYLN